MTERRKDVWVVPNVEVCDYHQNTISRMTIHIDIVFDGSCVQIILFSPLYPLLHYTQTLSHSIIIGSAEVDCTEIPHVLFALFQDVLDLPQLFIVKLEMLPGGNGEISISERTSSAVSVVLKLLMKSTPVKDLHQWLDITISRNRKLLEILSLRYSNIREIVNRKNPHLLIPMDKGVNWEHFYKDLLNGHGEIMQPISPATSELWANKYWRKHYSQSIFVTGTNAVVEIVSIYCKITREKEEFWLQIHWKDILYKCPLLCDFNGLHGIKKQIDHYLKSGDYTISIIYTERQHISMKIVEKGRWSETLIKEYMLQPAEMEDIVMSKSRDLSETLDKIRKVCNDLESAFKTIRKKQPSLLIAIKPIVSGHKIQEYDQFRITHAFLDSLY